MTEHLDLSLCPVIDFARISSEHFGEGNVPDKYSVFFVLGSEKKAAKFSSFGNSADSAGSSAVDAGGAGQMNGMSPAVSGIGGAAGILTDGFRVLPVAWDSLLVGMAVGEERLLTLPDCFFNAAEVKSRLSVMKTAAGSESYERDRLQLRIRLISINGDVV